VLRLQIELVFNACTIIIACTSLRRCGGHHGTEDSATDGLIDPAKKKAFETLCAQQDVTPSQVVRRLIREYLAAHGVGFVPGGADESQP